MLQIHHAGIETPKAVIDIAVSSSDYKADKKAARELSVEEIKVIQNKYAEAAARAERAGFDGIELHGAHGYLISQFLSPIINKRTDQYGGTIEGRMRFALEIVEMVKAAVSENFILGYRMGGNEPNLANGIVIAKALEKTGIDILHVSSGIGIDAELTIPKDFEYNSIVYYGVEVKKAVDIPVIVVNEIKTPERAEYLIQNQLADFTAIGKPQLADPAWTKHVSEGSETIKCMDCKRCMWESDGRKCPALRKRDK